MSPEQARGKPVDRRSDIWSFGCVLFEGLSGRKAFDGETILDVLAAVLTREPEWGLLPQETSGAHQELLARCFQKDPARRLRDAEPRFQAARPRLLFRGVDRSRLQPPL